MKTVPIEAAKNICNEFEKDQCIILSWDKKSGETWVTTYGVGEDNSKQACNAGIVLKDYLKLKREKDEIPEHFKEWEVESIDRYYYASGRNGWNYREVTFWFEKHTLERKETLRQIDIYTGQEWDLPTWAKSIKERRKSLETDRIY